jgi:2-oxoglutarate ferredoxin oxidoreductase subunit gamma
VSNQEIKLCGFGGQGVILAGEIIGQAAAIYDGKEATFTRSFGPEARGSTCTAQVIVSDEKILYPYVAHPNVMIVMSQESFNKFAKELTVDGVMLVESDLVKPDPAQMAPGQRVFGVPATRLAEELGRRIVMNMVMLGFVTAVTELAAPDSMSQSIRHSVPPGTEEFNLRAFATGYEYGLKEVEKQRAAH